MDIRSLQRPLKDHYRQDPSVRELPLSRVGSNRRANRCSIDLGRAIYSAQAHRAWEGQELEPVPATTSRRVSRLCTNHLPNGGCRYGSAD